MSVLESRHSLERRLGFWETLSIGVGSTIGGSIFVVLGDAVGMAGPAVVLSFVLGALITLVMALNYSELAASLPVSGGGYVFTREAVGGLISFATGWFLWVGNLLYAAMNATGFALILASFLPVEPITVAEAALAAFCLLNLVGVREAGRAQLALTLLLVSGLLALVLAAAPSISMSNFRPLAPKGIEGVIAATGFAFVAYWGFESIATVGGEVRKPGKIIPKCCILSVLACGAIYALISLASVGSLGWEALARSEVPLALLGRATLGPAGEVFVACLGGVATLTSLNSALLSAARIAHALARDGLFPEALASVHPKFRTPHNAVLLSSLAAAIFTLSGVAHFLAGAASFGFLAGLLMVNLSLLVLRRKRRYLAREFKVPLYPLTPLLAASTCVALMAFMDPVVLAMGSAVTVVGTIAFLFELTTAKAREAAIGGFSLASGLAVLFVLYVMGLSARPVPGAALSRAVAHGLLVMCVLQLVASFMTAIPLGELYISASKLLGSVGEPGGALPGRVAKVIKGLEWLMSSLQMASAVTAAAIIYGVYRGMVFFPSPPKPVELPLAVFTCMALAFFALANSACAFILIRRKYAVA